MFCICILFNKITYVVYLINPKIEIMKSSLILVLLFCSIQLNSQRYLTDVFSSLDSVIGGVYGTSVDYMSNTQNLLFDFYEPASDTLTKRPLLIYVHGGGFTSGSRTYPSVQMICRRMAKKGYAVANIDYRLDPGFDIYNSGTNRRAMTDAMHDAKQAIRFFKANATTYGIDTNLVFIGGESAGAATSMMASFIEKQSEMTAYPMANPNNPVGSTVNSGFSTKVKGTLCLCGLMLDTLAIDSPSDPPILWTHGTNDSYVPYSLAYNIVKRATNVGVSIQTKTYNGAIHCPWYFGNPNWSTYLDSAITDITTFIYPIVNNATGIAEHDIFSNLSLYPNPFNSRLNLEVNTSSTNTEIKLISSLGQVFFQQSFLENRIEIETEQLKPGVYFIHIERGNKRSVKKVIKQ